MTVELFIREGEQKGTRVSVSEEGDFLIGRSSKNNLQLSEQGVSRIHCRIHKTENGWELLDLDSSNGTHINGLRVRSHRLEAGDIIRIGKAALLFDMLTNGSVEPGSSSFRRQTVRLVEESASMDTAIRRKISPHTSVIAPGRSHLDPLGAKQGDQLQAVIDMGDLIYRERDVSTILQLGADCIIKAMRADRCSILTPDEGEAEYVSAVESYREGLAQEPFTVSRTIIHEAVTSGSSVLSSDATCDDRFKQGDSVLLQEIRSVMCVPLLSEQDAVIGAVYVDCHSPAIQFSEQDLSVLAALGRQVGLAMERALLVADLEELFISAMQSLVASIEAKDAYTRGHSERVTHLALLAADELKVPQEVREVVEVSGIVHDVGKIGIPLTVLNKPGQLDPEERRTIETHPVTGADIIKTLKHIERLVNMHETVRTIRHHHERFDGDGYPDRLHGETIPLGSRILAVADTYDAIASDRPYRKGRTGAVAMEIIQSCRGGQFDPEVVDAFQRVYDLGVIETPGQVETRFGLRSGTDSGCATDSIQTRSLLQ
ncbi:MAG: HD domain-containing phosphohydrolase [Planctomycetota bacterium]